MWWLVYGKPLVLFDLLDAETKLWVWHEHVQDQVFDFLGEEGWQLEVRFQDLLVERLGVLIFKGQVATGFRIENDACTPQVGFRTYVFFAFNEFRSCIARGATSSRQLLTRFEGVTQAKVYDLEVLEVIKQQVLRLNIPVRYSQLPQIFNARDELLEQTTGFLFLQSILRCDVVK